MGVRGVAGTYVVLGLAVAYFALYAIALHPATFHQLQMIRESDPHPPETDCAATVVEAMEMRADAVMLLLWGAAQALLAMAAVAATSRVGTVIGQLVSLPMAWRLLAVLAGVVDHAIGRCHGSYRQVLLAGYVIVAVTFSLLFVAGLLVVTLCGKAPAVAIESREMIDAAKTRQGAVPVLPMDALEDSGVRTVPNTALAAITSPGKPAPAPSGAASGIIGSAGTPSPNQGKTNHRAASTSQVPLRRRLGAVSRPQGHTAFASRQYGMSPSSAWTQQHLQYQSLPQLQDPTYTFVTTHYVPATGDDKTGRKTAGDPQDSASSKSGSTNHMRRSLNCGVRF